MCRHRVETPRDMELVIEMALDKKTSKDSQESSDFWKLGVE